MQREARRAGFVVLPWAHLAPYLLDQMEPSVTSARIPGSASVLHPRTPLQAEIGPELDVPNHSCIGKLYLGSSSTLTQERVRSLTNSSGFKNRNISAKEELGHS